mmetsp:Transcript_6273/g.23120  ORF Transcript_6273/g.23120 Transcript_6273/m.23120 type:complete len:231 (-) Transcript_6273:1243-1935(-)
MSRMRWLGKYSPIASAKLRPAKLESLPTSSSVIALAPGMPAPNEQPAPRKSTTCACSSRTKLATRPAKASSSTTLRNGWRNRNGTWAVAFTGAGCFCTEPPSGLPDTDVSSSLVMRGSRSSTPTRSLHPYSVLVQRVHLHPLCPLPSSAPVSARSPHLGQVTRVRTTSPMKCCCSFCLSLHGKVSSKLSGSSFTSRPRLLAGSRMVGNSIPTCMQGLPPSTPTRASAMAW